MTYVSIVVKAEKSVVHFQILASLRKKILPVKFAVQVLKSCTVFVMPLEAWICVPRLFLFCVVTCSKRPCKGRCLGQGVLLDVQKTNSFEITYEMKDAREPKPLNLKKI
jgi:hypothetical protein